MQPDPTKGWRRDRVPSGSAGAGGQTAGAWRGGAGVGDRAPSGCLPEASGSLRRGFWGSEGTFPPKSVRTLPRAS